MPLYSLGLIAILTVGAVYFIWKSNDHLECSETIVRTTNAAGNPVVTKQHICHEKYSF